jgi:hypothetical protein
MFKYLILFIFISGLFNSVSADDISYDITVGKNNFKSLSSECFINEQKTISGPTQEEDKFVLILSCLEKIPEQSKKFKSISMVLISNQKELDQFLQSDNPVLSFERILPFIGETQDLFSFNEEISYDSIPKLNQGEAALFVMSAKLVLKKSNNANSWKSFNIISACASGGGSYPNSILVNKTETNPIALNFSFESKIPRPRILSNKIITMGKARSLKLSLDVTPVQK